MNFDEGKRIVLALLKRKGKAKNSEILQALNGDEDLFHLIREDLIFNDLAEDKKGVGLVFIPSATNQTLLQDKADEKEEPFPTNTSRSFEKDTSPSKTEKRTNRPSDIDIAKDDEDENLWKKCDPWLSEHDDEDDIWGSSKKKKRNIFDDEDDPFKKQEKIHSRMTDNVITRRRSLRDDDINISDEDEDGYDEDDNDEDDNDENDNIRDKFLNSKGEKPWELFQIPMEESTVKKINLVYDINEIQLHPLAFRIQKDLSDKGYRVWINKKQVAGDEVLIPLITPGSIKRPNGSNLNDLILARSNHFLILPLIVSPYPFPLNIYRLGWINIQDWQNPILYQNLLNQCIQAIEQYKEFDSPYEELFNFLKPLDFGAEASALALDFTGREWLYEEFDDWVSQEDSRIFIITGNLGGGKSAIISQLAIKHPLSGAYFFCRNQWYSTLDATSLITTLSAQLLSQFTEFKDSLQQSTFYQNIHLSSSSLKFSDVPLETLLHSLILQPLAQVRGDTPLLLFIDDLHLADQQIIQEKNIIRLLKDNIAFFPNYVKFIFSCSKEAKLTDTFNKYNPTVCNLSRDENYVDINLYLENNFSVYPLYDMLTDKEVEPKDMVKLIIRKSRGNFLHAKQLVAAILWKIAEIDKPESFPDSLYDIYLGYFNLTFSNGDYGFMRMLLEVLLASYEPLSASQLAEFLNSDISTVEDHLLKVIFFFPLRDGKYQIAHSSISDWLSGKTTPNHPYIINLVDGHKRILEHIQAKIFTASPPNEYALFYAIHHFLAIKDYNSVINLLNNYDYIRIKIENGYFRNLLEDFSFVIKIFSSMVNSREIREPIIQWLKLLQAILKSSERSFKQNISQLANNLTGRCLVFTRFDFDNIPQKLLSQIREKTKEPWLRPLLPTLTPPGGVLINVLRGHQGKINALVLTPDSKKIITGADDTTIRVWDLERGSQIFLFTKHTKKINALAVNTDNTICVSASNDKYLHVWDLIQGKCVATLAGHTSYINSVVITPTGTNAISASSDNTIKIWDLSAPFTSAVPDSTRLINTLYGHTDSVEKVLLSPDGRKIISSSNDKTIRGWSLTTGELLYTIRGHKSIINLLYITSNNRFIISSSIEDYALKIWDIEDGNLVSIIRGHTGPITALAVSPDSKWIITGSADKTIKIWMIPPGLEYAKNFQPLELFTLKGHQNYIRSLAILYNRKLLISTAADKMIKIWHLETGKEIRTLQSDTEGYHSIFVSLDNKRLITPAFDNTVKIWDISYGLEVGLSKDIQINIEPAHTNDINAIVISQNGNHVITASGDGRCKCWKLNNISPLIYPLKTTNDVESHILTETLSFNNHASSVYSAVITPDGKHCVSAGYGIHLWNLMEGTEIRAFGQNEWIFAIAITPDGKWIISGSSEHTLKIWELSSGKSLGSLGDYREAASWITSLVVMPDGRRVVSAGIDKTIKIWDLHSGREIQAIRAHQDQINSLCLSSDGKLLFSASNDKTIKIWKTEQWNEVATLKGHLSSVRSIAVSRSNQYLVSASEDGVLILWELSNYTSVVKTSTFDRFYAVAITPHAEYILAGGYSGRLHIYHPENINTLPKN